jgi:hypothetical protein
MFQVAAISVATEPVTRIRTADLRDPTPRAQPPPAAAPETPASTVFDDPAAVVHIGEQARALAQREARQRESQPAPTSANDNPPLAEAARTAAQARSAAQARIVASVEGRDGEERTAESATSPLAAAASSAAKALWGDEADGAKAAGEADAADAPPDLVQASSGKAKDVELSAAEERKVAEMQKRDREVRQQEQSQASTGAQFTGPMHYEYRMGPDGNLYAVDGTVSIDVRPVQGDPVATLRKMEAVERAARSPSEPSMADHQVAAQAARLAQRARAELATARYAETRDSIDVRQPDAPGEPHPEARGGDGTQPDTPSSDTSRDVPSVENVLANPVPSVEETFSDAAEATALSPADLQSMNPGTTPALQSYEAQQSQSGFPGSGMQVLA